ncbi:MAG: hypothetical protein WCS03_09735 [Bacteroidota bacterium]
MRRYFFLIVIFFTIFFRSGPSGICAGSCEPVSYRIIEKDTLNENQILYNGRVWRNLYYMVKEDQFLFSHEFLPCSVTINGETFNNIGIRYDIFSDEIMTSVNNGSILQLNKEMVDSFTIFFQNKSYRFAKAQEDSLKSFKGYANVLVTGKISLFVKYKKEIANLAVDNKYDLFFLTQRIYLVKDGVPYLISGKREFFNHLDDYKVQIKSYIKKNRLKISKKNPESFVPVVQFYNSLRQ